MAARPQTHTVRINSRTICFYNSTTARFAYVKSSERTDALSTKLIFIGVLEDSTFKAQFVINLDPAHANGAQHGGEIIHR